MKKRWWATAPVVFLITTSTAVIAQASTLTSPSWQASGPGKTSAVATSQGGEDFTYNDSGDPNWAMQTRSWTFSSIASDTETLKFNWTYSGLHAWYMAGAGAIAFADGPNGRTTVTLKPWGGVWDSFYYTGTAQLPITKGYDYGFITSGTNFDGTWILRGDLTVNPAVTIPVTTATTDVQPNVAGWYNKDVTVTLSAADQGGTVASTMYSLDNGQTWNTYTAPFVVSTEGNDTVQYYSTSTDGGKEQPQTLSVPLDKTPPVISINGDNGTYSVDQTVNISVSSSDSLSGVASTSGQTSISGPAYSFNIGANSYPEGAVDNAGNVANTSADFNIIVTYDSLANLTSQLVNNAGIANSLDSKLETAKASAARGDSKAANNQLRAFDNELSAQSGKLISSSNSTLLTSLAAYLIQQ